MKCEVSVTCGNGQQRRKRSHAVLQVLLAGYCCVAARSATAQGNQQTGLSLQGYTGILNTPNAHVQQEGTLDILYSNQRERISTMNLSPWQDNYFFSLGMFKFAEIGGRLTNNTTADQTSSQAGRVRDLSLNLKLSSAPLTARYRFAPTLALGAADPGQGHHFFQTTYVVGSANPVSWLRLSAGYGHGPDRMKGGIAGGELRAFDWATILADYDTAHANVGVRLTAPELPFLRARLTATLSAPVQTSNPQKLALAGGFILPLSFKEHAKPTDQATLWRALNRRREGTSRATGSLPVDPAHASASIAPPVPSAPSEATTAVLQNQNPISPAQLREQLIQDGFVNVRVGQQGKTLVVQYENIRYNHSELDAIGVVCGLASRASGGEFDDLRVIVRRKGLPLLQLQTTLAPLYSWLEGDATAAPPSLSLSQDLASDAGITYVSGTSNPSYLKPSVVVYPSLLTLIGTEHGLFDYQLSIRPELQLPLWPGASFAARGDVPVSWSPNLSNGAIYSSFRTPARLDRAMVFQAIRLAPGVTANLGAGKILTSTNGTLNELNWIPGTGTSRLRFTQAWGRDNGTTRNVFLGSYRYQVPRYDVAVEATAGRFYAQDTGYLISLQRFFGDTSLSLYFKDIKSASDSQRYRQAGVRIDLPLTPRRDMKAAPVQFRGLQDWSFSQETGIVSSGTQATNFVKSDAAIVPETTESLAVYFYDRERLNEAYIAAHTARIKESWQHFRARL